MKNEEYREFVADRASACEHGHLGCSMTGRANGPCRDEYETAMSNTPNPGFCLDPEKCAGKASCPRDYACNE